MHVVLKRLPHLQSWDLLAILPGNTSWHRLALGAAEQGGLLTIWQIYGNYLATIWHWVLGNKVRSQLFGNYLALVAAERGGLLTIWYFFVQYLATL